MTLEEWLKEEPGRRTGRRARLVREASVTFDSIKKALRGELTRKDVALRISVATNGEVSWQSLLADGHLYRDDAIPSSIPPPPG